MDAREVNVTQLIAQSDMTPLGSFAWDPIGLVVNDVFSHAILTGATYSAGVDALDSCGALKAGYNGPTSLAYNGHSATLSGPTWSPAGVGTASIKPTVSETSRNLTLTDVPTNISATSSPFDTQDKICTSVDTSCAWHNGNNSINASANGPQTGSLGLTIRQAAAGLPAHPLVSFDNSEVRLARASGSGIVYFLSNLPASALTGWTLEGRYGAAICGSIAEQSNSITRA